MLLRHPLQSRVLRVDSTRHATRRATRLEMDIDTRMGKASPIGHPFGKIEKETKKEKGEQLRNSLHFPLKFEI